MQSEFTLRISTLGYSWISSLYSVSEVFPWFLYTSKAVQCQFSSF